MTQVTLGPAAIATRRELARTERGAWVRKALGKVVPTAIGLVIFVVLAMGVILTWWWNGSSTKTKLCNLRLNCIQGFAGGKHMSIQLSLEVIHPLAMVWSKGVFWLTRSIAPMIANMTPCHGSRNIRAAHKIKK